MPTPGALSVSELTAQMKRLLEQGFSRVSVSGEVSRLASRSGGHIYFTIKDAHAALSAVIWKSTAVRLASPPEEGRQYVFHGHISLYPPQGRYQLVVSRLEEEGGGALAAEFERRKRLFAERGWFDAGRKQSPPALPSHIGIVTSRTAAALQDVRKVLASRPGWLRLTLAASPVQGNAAPSAIVRALRQLQDMQDRPDVILLVRGGGSPEDLWCFNDETVVRGIVECTIPVITGIGHEIDATLSDYAADVHAATPSNAAELACLAAEALRRQMPRIGLLRQLLQRQMAHARQSANQVEAALGHCWRIGRDERRMHIERMGHLLAGHGRQLLRSKRQRLRHIEKRLVPLEPGQRLRLRQRRLDEAMQGLRSAAQQEMQQSARGLDRLRQGMHLLRDDFIERHRHQLDMRHGQLMALGPQAVLRRGYTLALAADGRILRSIRQVGENDRLHIRFHDGSADARITGRHADTTPPKEPGKT